MVTELSKHDTYQSPFVERWASEEMIRLFSANTKFRTWRKLWVALAEAEKELGLDISAEQIAELKRFQNDINYDVAEARERQVRHDVMAHVHAYGVQCPKAKPIIHLGATSAYVGDNTDLILMRDGLKVVQRKLVNVIDALARFARQHRDLVTLGYTHYQAAQPTTVGKRACLWIQDFLLDLEELEHRLKTLRFRGVKGTTGTQASFLSLFSGDHKKVRNLDQLVARKMGFPASFPVTGQTYTRKVDSQVLDVLAGIGQSAHKFGNDLRLLHNLKEVEEPFEAEQIGSSAMAYKRNPMRSERMCSLARFVISTAANPAFTAATQWLERTLDDSANRRITLAEAFLATDSLLNVALNVAGGLVVYPKMIERHVADEMPFMATEEILMAAVKAGGDRQALHERIRKHSMAATRRVRAEGKPNDLLKRIAADPAFARIKAKLPHILDPAKFIGRAPLQVDEFLAEVVTPILKRHKKLLGMKAELTV